MSTSSDNRTIEDILLKPDAIPAMPPKTMVKEALEMMTAGRLGLACVVDRKGCLVGLFTDGDLRRLLLRSQKPLSALFNNVLSQTKKLHVVIMEPMLLFRKMNALNVFVVFQKPVNPIGLIA